MDKFRRTLLERASRPYFLGGHFAGNFCKGKLKGDPIFLALLEHGSIPNAARLLDLGCGKGLLASWLNAARLMYETNLWPQHWPPAPKLAQFSGLDLDQGDVDVARTALVKNATLDFQVNFEVGDIHSAHFGTADVVIILDVLHYIAYDAQENVIRRVRAALPLGGILILRIGDAAGGLPFLYSKWVDRSVLFLRGYRGVRLYCRTLESWIDLLGREGFNVSPLAMSKGTIFCNVTLLAKAI
jgi:SAM-dependent methyltransferase